VSRTQGDMCIYGDVYPCGGGVGGCGGGGDNGDSGDVPDCVV